VKGTVTTTWPGAPAISGSSARGFTSTGGPSKLPSNEPVTPNDLPWPTKISQSICAACDVGVVPAKNSICSSRIGSSTAPCRLAAECHCW